MLRYEKEDSVDSVTTGVTEEIKTEASGENPQANEGTDDEDVKLESIDESDISSVQSLPDDLAKSLNYTSEIATEFRTHNSTTRTPRTQRTFSYTDDFEADSFDPRGAVNEPLTARTIASAAYSSDFESSWYSDNFNKGKSSKSPQTHGKEKATTDRSLNLDTAGKSYSTESFESDAGYTERTESESESESVSVTQTSFSGSSYSEPSNKTKDDSSIHSVESFLPDSEDERKFIDAKYDFFVKKLMLLERKNRGEYVLEHPVEQGKSNRRDLLSFFLDIRESKRQRSFCQHKVELLRRKAHHAVPTEDPAQAPEPVRIFSQIANDKMEDHGIPEAALHRLQMQNTMHNITKAAKIKVHKPKNCHECRDKLAEATERSFLQQKVAVVSEKLLKDKILMQGNEIQEFAAGLKEFPSHKDNPEVIYNRLMRTGQQKSSVAVQTVETRAPEEAVRRLKDYTKSELKLENMDLAKGPPRQFWDKYFEPLNNCAWYPKSPGK